MPGGVGKRRRQTQGALVSQCLTNCRPAGSFTWDLEGWLGASLSTFEMGGSLK